MELAFLTLLLKDGANRVSGGVAINNERVLEAGLTKDRGRANGIYKGLKGGFVFVFPIKFASFGTKRDERVKGGGQSAEVANVHAIEVEKAQECPQFAKGCGSFPIFDAIDFDRVHGDAVFTDNDAEVLHFCNFELAFLRFKVEVVIGQNAQYIVNNMSVQLQIIRRVDEDIIHVDGNVAFID